MYTIWFARLLVALFPGAEARRAAQISFADDKQILVSDSAAEDKQSPEKNSMGPDIQITVDPGKFDLGPANWSLMGNDCTRCGGIPFEDLQREGDFALGCSAVLKSAGAGYDEVPRCPLWAKNGEGVQQAGGHAGAFYKLKKDRIAKVTSAFQNEGGHNAGRVEWVAYTEFWCLRRLDELIKAGSANDPKESELLAKLSVKTKNEVLSHPLRAFAVGTDRFDAIAPVFSGVCRVDGDVSASKLYLVLEDLLNKFQKPCQIDLKLGRYTVEPSDKIRKKMMMKVADQLSTSDNYGVRMAGFKVWNPWKRSWSTMRRKALDPMITSIASSLTHFLDDSGNEDNTPLLSQLMAQAFLVGTHWTTHLKPYIRAIAVSVLMAYECQPDVEDVVIVSNVTMHMRSEYVKMNKPTFHISQVQERLFYPRRRETFDYVKFDGTTLPRQFMSGPPHHQEVKDGIGERMTSFMWKGDVFNLQRRKGVDQVTLETSNVGDQPFGLRDVLRLPLGDPYNTQRAELFGTAPNKKAFKYCTGLGTSPGDTLCADIRLEKPDETRNSRVTPIFKLIDFAHFFPAYSVPTWRTVDNDVGLLTLTSELERRVWKRLWLRSKADSNMSKNPWDLPLAREQIGKRGNVITQRDSGMKCPEFGHEGKGKKNSAGDVDIPEAQITEHGCKLYMQLLNKKYSTWKGNKDRCRSPEVCSSSPKGSCRACDELVKRRGDRWISRKVFGKASEVIVFETA